MSVISNPVLPGFNPDPSFCRVGEDYYLATSTFEWYPGVQIFKSNDLVNWDLVARPLDRASLLDMRGTQDSGGVWAPCLSYADGRFWLVYSHMKRNDEAFKDCRSFVTSCQTIDGYWSDPIPAHSGGFDPSLFHDEDGKKWIVSLRWNHRPEGHAAHPGFGGIALQQWSQAQGNFGPVHTIFDGSQLGLCEAPHLFRRNGYIYLTTAEGGTFYDHAVTMARSRNLLGPYELHPERHLITAKDAPNALLQRTGHGQYVETHWGDHYHSFLMSRPIPGPDGTGQYSPMGRETGLEKVEWRDDWLWLEHGGTLARKNVPAPSKATPPKPDQTQTRFEEGKLPPEFQWLRTPEPERLFHVEPGALVLTGRDSLGSWQEQSLVARRQTRPAYEAASEIEFDPQTYQQAAGLVCYYNRYKFHALLITHEPGYGRALRVVSCKADWPQARLTWSGDPLPAPPGRLSLGVRVNYADLQFVHANKEIGPTLDATLLSDEAGSVDGVRYFTCAFVGVAAFDLTGRGKQTRVTQFSYT